MLRTRFQPTLRPTASRNFAAGITAMLPLPVSFIVTARPEAVWLNTLASSIWRGLSTPADRKAAESSAAPIGTDQRVAPSRVHQLSRWIGR